MRTTPAFAILLVMSVTPSLGVIEPTCGAFDMLERILSKLLKQEMKLDTFESTIQKWEKTIEKRWSDAKQHAENVLNTAIGEIEAAAKLELQAIQATALQTPNVFFTAKYVHDKDVAEDKVVIFTTVVNNEGGGRKTGYDPHTGYFTAPHAGLYMFHATICSMNKKGVYVRLMMEDTALSSTEKYHDVTGGTCTSLSGVTTMRKGDRACVKGTYENKKALYTSTNLSWPSFSGALIHL